MPAVNVTDPVHIEIESLLPTPPIVIEAEEAEEVATVLTPVEETYPPLPAGKVIVNGAP